SKRLVLRFILLCPTRQVTLALSGISCQGKNYRFFTDISLRMGAADGWWPESHFGPPNGGVRGVGRRGASEVLADPARAGGAPGRRLTSLAPRGRQQDGAERRGQRLRRRTRVASAVT